MYTKKWIYLFVLGFILRAYICAGNVRVSTQGATLSTNESVWDVWEIKRAIDGGTGSPGVCGCCTAIKRPSWLQLNLPQTYFVERVVLNGRTDTAYNQLRNIEMLGGFDEHHMVAQQATRFSDTIRTYEISPPQAMQAIRVIGRGDDYMTICEIEIYRQEDCMNGTYGPNCENRCHCLEGPCDTINGTCGSGCQAGCRGAACHETCDNGLYGRDCLTKCGYCLNNAACNKTSGVCPVGCAAGYNGSLCKDECDNGSHGLGCQNMCGNCQNKVPCNKISGVCPGQCEPGYIGTMCTYECDNGWYGQGCLTGCGHCLNNAACNKTSGVCPTGCTTGYKGSLCIDECDNGWYGQGCLTGCGHCLNNAACNKTSGMCPSGCTTGYKESLCIDECDNGWYGQGCLTGCGHCLNNAACNKTSGVCPTGCATGYKGSLCIDECDNGWYGQGCLTGCGHCLNNAACNKTSGVCPSGCTTGYKGSLCIDECENERYGLACEKTCGHCKNKVPCNKLSGVCPGECEPGYNGTMCIEACDDGFFGDNCSAACGKCSGACHHIDGTCSQGCEKGFEGDLCMTQLIQSELIGPAVGGSVGVVVVIAIVIVSIIAIRRRRSTPTKRNQFDDIPVAIQNIKDSKIDQTPTTSETKPLKGPNRAIPNAVYANTASPEEDGLYYNSEPLHRERKRTEISPIGVDKLREFVRDNYQNENIFQQEFDKIPYGLQHPTIVASAATGKNRYKEMYAYDHSRVILRRIADEPNSDYINACHVDGYMEEKKYIASQGPVNPMVGDFWRMVWEQDVCIIVMVTKLVEEGKMKCLKYWGEIKPIIHGTFAVTLSEENDYSCYTIRTMTVHEKDKPHISRNVTQFHYTSWPDKSVPTSSTSLVQFWRKIRCQKRTTKQPWLIHCSAGVGRTGTFIAMDYIYDQGKETGNIDIPQCVTNLRAQRVNMVQTASQYRFLYKLMLEMLVLPSQPVTTEQLNGENMELKEQYLDLSTEESLFPDDNTYKSATANENQSKNRSMDILAADNYRPYLSSHIPNTTDYINAVIMPSFKLPTRFIITQAPLEHSCVDFCRLICEKEIELIISFNDSMSEEEKCLPGENETKSISGIRLTGVSCEPKDGPDFYTRSFDLNLKQKTHRFSQIVYTGWSQPMELPQSPRSFMDLLRYVRNVTRSEVPILVQCLNGADKSGLFVVIWTLLEHVEIDGEVSIPRVVRHLRLRRKQIIPTFDQFKFCADCIALDDANTYANFQKMSS